MNQLAKRIFEAAHLTGEFTLRSGLKSEEYFDKYLFESDPGLLNDIAEAITQKTPAQIFRNADFLGGLEMGGIPVVTMISQKTGIASLFVRKKAKTHGTNKLAEGQIFADKQVVIVEDVVSSGGQIVLSAADLRERGAIVTDAICVIDRESGGREALGAIGITLHPLFLASELKP